VPCSGLNEERHLLLAQTCVAGDLGGVGSIAIRVATAKRLFPYKNWPTDSSSDEDATVGESETVPAKGNENTNLRLFTEWEKGVLQEDLASRRKWYTDGEPGRRVIRAEGCARRVRMYGGVQPLCEMCTQLKKDKSFTRQLRRVGLSLYVQRQAILTAVCRSTIA
jgi:hypothetical protein